MDQQQSDFKPSQQQCSPIDFTSTERFRTVEELLEARSGASFYLQPWCICGMPAFSEYPAKSL
jgi:hypothetical protein